MPLDKPKLRLSKSRFVAGWQCHKLLWWKVHEPRATELEPSIVLEDRFDQDRRVEQLARERFPDGVAIDVDYRNRELAVQATKAALEELEHKLIDLPPVVRDYVYHPGFQGSFSLKYILTPLVPELTYDDLVIIDGLVAGVEIARLLFVAGKLSPEQQEKTRQDLLDYCERDTWATVRLVERLGELAAM